MNSTTGIPIESGYINKFNLKEPMDPKESQFAFLQSTRFWVMCIGAVSVYLQSKGWLGVEERNLIATLSTVFVTVRTLDRGAEKMGK